jgi:hypothetical protein
MTLGGKTLVWVVGGMAVCLAANGTVAASAQNPYQGIVERNVFGLRAPAPPPDPEATKPPPPKITLTGVTTILGNKRVLFKVQWPARPPEPAREQSYILTVGQREGQIEVLEIDENAGAIKFNNSGTVMTLTMDKDAAKLPNTPPLPQPAQLLQNPNPVTYVHPPVPTAGVPQPHVESTEATPGMKTIPTRTLRLPNRPMPAEGMPPLPGALTPR